MSKNIVNIQGYDFDLNKPEIKKMTKEHFMNAFGRKRKHSTKKDKEGKPVSLPSLMDNVEKGWKALKANLEPAK